MFRTVVFEKKEHFMIGTYCLEKKHFLRNIHHIDFDRIPSLQPR